MLYVHRIQALLCLCVMTRSVYANKEVINLTIEPIERNKNMHNQIEPKKFGKFSAKDKQGIPVILEWYKTSIVSMDFAASMKEVWEFARDAYTPVEMQFLKAFPDVVGKEPYFKSFEQLFQQGVANVDWKAAEETMQSILQGHFVFDPSKFPEQVIKMYESDQVFLVVVKDKATGKSLGFITFMVRANYPVGDVKVMSFAMDTAHQKRGLGKLLMSSIFKIVPDIKRIFLCTRVTNDTALKAYSSWGFVNDDKPILDHAFNLEHWTFMEYKVAASDALQKVAASLVE